MFIKTNECIQMDCYLLKSFCTLHDAYWCMEKHRPVTESISQEPKSLRNTMYFQGGQVKKCS